MSESCPHAHRGPARAEMGPSVLPMARPVDANFSGDFKQRRKPMCRPSQRSRSNIRSMGHARPGDRQRSILAQTFYRSRRGFPSPGDFDSDGRVDRPRHLRRRLRLRHADAGTVSSSARSRSDQRVVTKVAWILGGDPHATLSPRRERDERTALPERDDLRDPVTIAAGGAVLTPPTSTKSRDDVCLAQLDRISVC